MWSTLFYYISVADLSNDHSVNAGGFITGLWILQTLNLFMLSLKPSATMTSPSKSENSLHSFTLSFNLYVLPPYSSPMLNNPILSIFNLSSSVEVLMTRPTILWTSSWTGMPNSSNWVTLSCFYSLSLMILKCWSSELVRSYAVKFKKSYCSTGSTSIFTLAFSL